MTVKKAMKAAIDLVTACFKLNCEKCIFYNKEKEKCAIGTPARWDMKTVITNKIEKELENNEE